VDLADRADQLDVEAAVSRLPLDDRRLVALRYSGGLTSAEIADALGASPSAIRGRLARILVRLRKDLGDD
jgi:RNA polymerase sigma factor (sigma-70 family)